ncbi:HEAT repeat domain-containing protein [Anaerolineae bacterium CFX9]|nr:HEAT repeat domain-containing protein [Anaerolineae bacterium CFX9]
MTIERWIEDLHHTDPAVRLSAEASLIEAGREAAVPLIAALQRGNLPVEARWRACCVLGDIGAPEAVDPLIALLGDPAWEVRHSAVYALAHLRDARSFGPLQRVLLRGYKDEQIPYVAAIGLAQIDPARGGEALKQAADHPDDVISSIARSALTGLDYLR